MFTVSIPCNVPVLPEIFGNGHEHLRRQADAEKNELYKQIGQFKAELDFLKKRAGLIT